MKKFKKMLYLFCLVGALLPLRAEAVPELQLYIPGATYDSANQTWVTASSEFDLWVLGNVAGDGGQGTINDVWLAASLYGSGGSIVATATTTTLVTDPSTPSAISGVTTSGKTVPNGILNHAEYSNANSHLYYGLGNFSLTDSPITDVSPGFTFGTDLVGQINVYHMVVSGYEMVHFDAYDTVVSGNSANLRVVSSPNSHDASTTPVPEPSTLLLLGVGLGGLGLAGFKRGKTV